jgi:hypothetical protein
MVCPCAANTNDLGAVCFNVAFFLGAMIGSRQAETICSFNSCMFRSNCNSLHSINIVVKGRTAVVVRYSVSAIEKLGTVLEKRNEHA